MLLVNAKILGDRVIIADIDRIGRRYPDAVVRGVGRIIIGVNKEAVKNLSGPGAKPKKGKKAIGAGGYPVPVRRGNLRRLENFVLPGRTKTTNGMTFGAGDMGGIVYNTALYSRVIHEGRGSSKKHGPRPYITDAVLSFDRGGKMVRVLDEEVSKEL
ncbi:MAG: hypothetical protein GY774_16515 [Planctomycetes bacterium]|nr:hypothetical protein [Planctomycetota bacterium]